MFLIKNENDEKYDFNNLNNMINLIELNINIRENIGSYNIKENSLISLKKLIITYSYYPQIQIIFLVNKLVGIVYTIIL